MKKAFITGISGQDGSYLTELLLDKGYEVHGTVRRTSSLSRSRLDHLYRDPAIYNKRLFLHYADLDDPTPMRRALVRAAPDELYHLAGQSHVGISFEIPESTCESTAMGTLRLLEAVRDLPKTPKFYHAASSEMFGRPSTAPQDESTPFNPVSPYGCAKVFATHMVAVYRQTYGLFACNGVLYNHESPRRGENFVTRKICRGAAAIRLGLETSLRLGNLASERDWGHARDYVRAMWLMLQHNNPEDFVIATGKPHSVRDVAQAAFQAVNLDWSKYVVEDPRFYRPAEPLSLVGNSAKAERLLGWTPEVRFADMIREMTLAEMEILRPTAT